MKILLLTDIPPCKNFTAGLVLDQLCRFLPKESIACFAIVNPAIDAKLTPDLDWIPIAYARKRNEAAWRFSLRPFIDRVGRLRDKIARIHPGLAAPFRPIIGLMNVLANPARTPSRIRSEIGRLLFFPTTWAVETLYRRIAVPRLAEKAVAFGRAQKVDLVWAVLQGQTLVQIAPEVAARLGVDLVTQVWDPLEWWLLANRIDRLNRRVALADFDRALSASRACITASWAMARDYEARYGTRSIPVITSHPEDWGCTPDLAPFPRDAITIGMAGQFYAGSEWLQLLRAMNMSGWTVRGRPVTITVLGAVPPPGEAPSGRVRHLGWHEQRDGIALLSTLDLLYCPYPFAPDMKEVSRLSFPSKVVMYLAAGRPILLHGPDFASPAIYLRERGAGLVVPDFNAAAIYNGLCRLVDDPALYRELGRNAQRAFQRDFTLPSMRAAFEAALGIDAAKHAAREAAGGSPG